MKLKRFQRNRKKSDIKTSFVLTADDVIRFSWSFGFTLQSTMYSLKERGFLISKQEVIEIWVQLDELMESV